MASSTSILPIRNDVQAATSQQELQEACSPSAPNLSNDTLLLPKL